MGFVKAPAKEIPTKEVDSMLNGYHCLLCNVSSEEQPLTHYSNLDFSVSFFLCESCQKKVLAKTNGIIPINLPQLLRGDVEELEGGEPGEKRKKTKCCGCNTQTEFNLSRSLGLLLKL